MLRARKGEARAFLFRAVDLNTDECISWPYSKNTLGYGSTAYKGKAWLAHRLAYQLRHGEVPSLLRHTCDNPSCINHAHLVEGTHVDNMRDMVERGRQCMGERRATKLTAEQVRYIKANYIKGRNRYVRGNGRELADKFGVSIDYVNELAVGRTKWKSLEV